VADNAVREGGKLISPFGLIALAMRSHLRKMIHAQYPYLQSDCESGGLASYVKDVAMDIDIVENGRDEQGGASQKALRRAKRPTGIMIATSTISSTDFSGMEKDYIPWPEQRNVSKASILPQHRVDGSF
jgi:hypothetical protein